MLVGGRAVVGSQMPKGSEKLELTVELRGRTSGSSQKRRAVRHTILCEAIWDHRCGEGETGSILDISAAGLFMSADSGVPDDLRVGDTIWGSFRIGGEAYDFSATVRWRGYSRRHERSGIGVEFDSRTQLPAQVLSLMLGRHALPSAP